MSADKRYTTIQLRRGNNADFAGKILASGEPAYAIDTSTLKIGDGTTTWSSLGSLTAASGGGSMNNVVDDTSPTLGGELNLDNNDIVIDCKNSTGSPINAGTPVYVSGYYSANGKALIAPAIGNDSSKMPAIGMLNSTLNDGDEGTLGVMGVVSHINTSLFDIGDTVYVAATGGLTNTKPTGNNDLIQNLGRVLRKDSSQGRIILLGAGRSNDVPNTADFNSLTVNSNNVVISSTGLAGGGSGVNNIVQISQTDFDALGSTDSNTIYFIN